jgi:hypothetical protein
MGKIQQKEVGHSKKRHSLQGEVFQNIEWSGHFMWVFCFSKCPAICGGHILDFTMCHVEIH